MRDVFFGFEKAAALWDGESSWKDYAAPAAAAAALVGAGGYGLYLAGSKGRVLSRFGSAAKAVSSRSARAASSSKGVGASAAAKAKLFQERTMSFESSPLLAKYQNVRLSPSSEKELLRAFLDFERSAATAASSGRPPIKEFESFLRAFEAIERKEPALKGFCQAVRNHFAGAF